MRDGRASKVKSFSYLKDIERALGFEHNQDVLSAWVSEGVEYQGALSSYFSDLGNT